VKGTVVVSIYVYPERTGRAGSVCSLLAEVKRIVVKGMHLFTYVKGMG
jgi:hypothetical protein